MFSSIGLKVAILLGLGNFVSGFGLLDFHEECDFDTDYRTYQSHLDQSKYCDTARGLYCVVGLGRCGCVVPHTIYRDGKCRAKVGNGCLAPGNVYLDCVEHAECTKNNTSTATFQCKCMRGYLTNAMRTACFPDTYYTRLNRRKYDRYGYPYWNTSACTQLSLAFIAITSALTILNYYVQ